MMESTTDKFSLGGGFPSLDRAAWRSLVDGVLKDKSYDKVMLSPTLTGLTLEPLYAADNATIEPQPAGRTGEWGIETPHWNPDAAATNAAILEDLERGATEVSLRLAAGGTPGIAIEGLDAALAGVHLDMAAVNLLPGEDFAAAADAYLSLCKARNVQVVGGSLGVDPLGVLAQSGRLPTSLEQAFDDGVAIARLVSGEQSALQTFLVDASIVHTAGGTEAMELGYMLAAGIAYLRAMEAAGLSLSTAATQISFQLAADADVMLGIAKLRAARRLWARVLEAIDVANTAPMSLTAVLSLRALTIKVRG